MDDPKLLVLSGLLSWRKSRAWQVLFFFKSLVLFVYPPISMLCQCSPLRSFLKEIRTWRDQNFELDPLAIVRASSWWLSYSKHCEEVHCLNPSHWKFTSLITPRFRQPYIKRRIVHKDSMKCEFLQIHQFDVFKFLEIIITSILTPSLGPGWTNCSLSLEVSSKGHMDPEIATPHQFRWIHLMWYRWGEKTLGKFKKKSFNGSLCLYLFMG